ncbi:hypothetical protein ACF0H5_007387 [Mactra antiquata]
MGKRKQSAPQKADEDKRKCLTWNMMDMPNGDNSLINDDVEVVNSVINYPVVMETNHSKERKPLPSESISNEISNIGQCYRRDDLLDIFNLHVENCLFCFPIQSKMNFKDNDWRCTLAKFKLVFSPSPVFVPLPSNTLPDVEQFTLHVSSEGEKNIISYFVPTNTGMKNSKTNRKSKVNIEGDVKFWLVDTDIPVPVLEAFKCKSISVLIDKFDSKDMSIYLEVIGTKMIISNLNFPSEPIRSTKLINQSVKIIMDYFYGISAPDYDGMTFTKKHNIDELYQTIKKQHMKDFSGVMPNVQHPDLLPRLRPYQQQAITWMLHKEKAMETIKDDLHELYSEIVTLDGQTLFFNKYAGVCVRDRPTILSRPPGGILGEEMGLGKTVEVLACMLHNPRDGIPLPEPLPVIEEVAVKETKMKKKRKRKAKRRSDSFSDCDSDDTIIYDEPSFDVMNSSVNQSGCLTENESQTKQKTENGCQSEVVMENGCQSDIVGEIEKQTKVDGSFDYKINSETKKNIFTEKPKDQMEKFECICGATDPSIHVNRRKKKHIVQCSVCHLLQHAECVNYDLYDPLRGEFKCPHCHVASDPIPSGATLIISPFSIAHQWVEEILKHIKKEALNVLMYKGVHKQGFLQPRMLARQDIVITTYETLRKEIDYVDLPHSNSSEGRKLRHAKRFMAIPSPITAVQWWRICIDEAQMLECTTTKTAEMARRLSGINRWCVTGTPIQKSIDDLYGLVLFLGIDPYWVLMWWNKLIYEPFCYDIRQPMYDLLTSTLWRTVKDDVVDQINIPAQSDGTHWLTFSPVEEHFYRRQYRDCVRLSMERLSKWTDSNIRLSSLDRHTVSQLLYPLLRLRQACCHPQAVRGEFLPINKTTMTMEELLDALTKKAKLEAEESHRALVAAINGEAGLHIINEEYSESVEKYRDVLRSVEEHKDTLKTDTLQQLHAMYNLREILNTKPDGVSPTLRDDLLETQILELKDKYMAKAVAYVKSTEEILIPAQNDVKQAQNEFTDYYEWWIEVIQWASDRDMDDKIVTKVRDDLLDNRNPQINTLVRSCRSTAGLEYAIHTQLNGIDKSYKEVLSAMKTLEGVPSQDLINKTVECCLRPVDEILKNCPFCKTEDLFEVYEAKLFSFVEKGVESHMDTGYQVNTRRQGTWADSEVEKALKSILSYAKHNKVTEDLIDQGTIHLKLFDAMKKEFKKLRSHWAGIKEYVASFDELDMSITRLRLRLPDEPVPETPQMNILERTELSQHKLKLASDKIIARAELRKKLGQLLYLTNLAKNQSNNKDGSNPEPCPICQQELGKEWSVMQCGHCYCIDCIRILVERASFGRRNFTVKCAVCRQNTHQGEISYVMTSRELQPDDIAVKGSHSTKVEAVIRCLLQIQKEDPTAKSLVFSTWTDVLSVIASGLDDNDITYKALYSSGKFQENLSSFREDKDVTTLLLPVHSGANGLNLIEATHVLLVEPILNPAQELQAIGRVHRIGQTKPTHVHRFIIRNTIEQKMMVLLQSMNKHNLLEKSEESSLTIGDLSSLFTQQIEDDNREGVHSPGDDDDQDHHQSQGHHQGQSSEGQADMLCQDGGDVSHQNEHESLPSVCLSSHASTSSGCDDIISEHSQIGTGVHVQERSCQGQNDGVSSQSQIIANDANISSEINGCDSTVDQCKLGQLCVQSCTQERSDQGHTVEQTDLAVINNQTNTTIVSSCESHIVSVISNNTSIEKSCDINEGSVQGHLSDEGQSERSNVCVPSVYGDNSGISDTFKHCTDHKSLPISLQSFTGASDEGMVNSNLVRQGDPPDNSGDNHAISHCVENVPETTSLPQVNVCDTIEEFHQDSHVLVKEGCQQNTGSQFTASDTCTIKSLDNSSNEYSRNEPVPGPSNL